MQLRRLTNYNVTAYNIRTLAHVVNSYEKEPFMMKRERRKERLWVRVSASEKRGLEQAALERDTTPSMLVRFAIKQVLAGKGERTR
jgi:hypothetical protein